MKVWAFNSADDERTRELIYQSARGGRSRFGWSSRDENNLKLKDNWTEEHPRQLFLLEIQEADWIVHINTPEWGKCIAGRVACEYDFDDGLQLAEAADFRHFLEIDTETIVEFDRTDPNVLPSVNLCPRGRYHRINAVDDFLRSIDNLGTDRVVLGHGETLEEYHLKDKAERYLEEMTTLIHGMHKKKRLERFLARVFRKIPGVVHVDENGFGWGTDHGADLIVKTRQSIGHLDFERTVVVQIKSFEGEHHEVAAVEQIRTAIKQFNAEAGMIITTGQRTEALESKIQEVSKELDRDIDLMAGRDVARFVVRYASDLLFRLEAAN